MTEPTGVLRPKLEACEQALHAAKAEIDLERELRRVAEQRLESMRADFDHSLADLTAGYPERANAAETECERLREALEEIATGGLVERGCVQVATAALALKPPK